MFPSSQEKRVPANEHHEGEEDEGGDGDNEAGDDAGVDLEDLVDLGEGLRGVALLADEDAAREGGGSAVEAPRVEEGLDEGEDAEVVDGLGQEVGEVGQVLERVVEHLDADLVLAGALLAVAEAEQDLVEADGEAGAALGTPPLDADLDGNNYN